MSTRNPYRPTHEELVQRAVRWMKTSMGYTVVFAELTCSSVEVPDALGWRWGGDDSLKVEVKISRGDFFRDRKKAHWDRPGGPGQERVYMTPPGLVRKEDLPEGWGLVYAHPRKVVWVHRAGPCRDDQERLLRKAAELPFLVSACRRFTLRVPFSGRTQRFRPFSQMKRDG